MNDLEATAQDLLLEANHLDDLAENATTDDEWAELSEEADAKRCEAHDIFNSIY